MRWASFGVSPSSAWFGRPGRSKARRGGAWFSAARVAMAARRAYGPSLPPSLADVARSGWAGLSAVWHGGARRGRAWAADSSTEPLRGFPAALIREQTRQGSARHGAVRRGWVQHGELWSGKARHGLARTDDLSTEGASLPYWAHSTHFMA